MNINIFMNRKNPDDVKFFVAPAALLAWIKALPTHGDKWTQEFDHDMKEQLAALCFQDVASVEVSFFNYENEILDALEKAAPKTFDTLAKAWVYAEENNCKVIKTIAFS